MHRITGRLPRPVWCVELEIQEERLVVLARSDLNGTFGEQVGQVAFEANLLCTIIEVMLQCFRIQVTRIIGSGTGKAKEFIEAVMQRVILRQQSEMPFAY